MGFHNSGGGGDGERLTETVLWTNPSPTARFTTQDVTLSDNINNYRYLKFVFMASVSDQRPKCSIYPVDEFKGYSLTSNQWSRATSPTRRNSSTVDFLRCVLYLSDTSVNITEAQGFHASSTNNDSTIPYQIIGVKRV